MIAIADYGIGNLGSIERALRLCAVGAEGKRPHEVRLVAGASELAGADAIVLPGDGAFGATMRALRERAFDRAVLDAHARGAWILGVCVGMQALFERSDERGDHVGLGLLPGRVRRLPEGVRVPHMGWNSLRFTRETPLAAGLGASPFVYFVHSFACEAAAGDTIAVSTHGLTFPAVVQRGRLVGVQFHPEKSQAPGRRLLKNILSLIP